MAKVGKSADPPSYNPYFQINLMSIKTVSFLASLSVLISVLLMVIRTYFAISFSEPLQGMTRGVEYEPLFSIWKYVVGRSVYTDQNAIPFSASFYNWLFYAAYGEVVRVAQFVFSLSDAWLPTITRLTTLVGAFVGAIVGYFSFVDTLKPVRQEVKIIVAAMSTFLFFGPLIGFFAIAAGPDIWPMVFTVAALWIFISQYNDRPVKTILIVCLFSYLSWAFKQNFLYTPATVGLYLLIKHRWRDAAILTTVMLGAGVVTLAIGGPVYSKMLYFGGTHVFFTFGLLVKNIVNFTIKFLPVLAVGAASLLYLDKVRQVMSENFKQSPMLIVPFLGGVITGIEMLVTTGLQASSENHFFVFSYFLTFSALAIIIWMDRNKILSNTFAGIIALGWVGNIVAVAMVLFGVAGVLSVRPYNDNLIAARDCLKNLPGPFFISNSYLALPWMVAAEKPFVVHNAYMKDRAAGIKKENGGIGGLIDSGYFATVVISEGGNGAFDGSSLSLYQKRDKPCGGLGIYDRKKDPNFPRTQ